MAKKTTERKSATVTGLIFISKDPRVYAEMIPKVAEAHKRAIGVDLGTRCGIAFCDFVPGVRISGGPLVMGQWDLSLGPYDSGPLRHIRLKQFLAILQPDLILYEEVKYDPPQAAFKGVSNPLGAVVARVARAAEFLGGLKVTLTTWAEENDIPAQAVQISQIKKWAVGRGRANKEEMIEACNTRFGTTFATDDYDKTGIDNICDAAFVCAMGVEAYSEGL